MASSSVFLNVANIDKSIEFYQSLGFRVLSKTGEDGKTYWADLSLNGADLGLGAISSSSDPEFRAWVSTPLGAGVVAYFTVNDVDRIYAKAQKAGAVIEHPPQDRSYGRALTINDLDGYVLVFLKERAARKPAAKKARAAPAKASKKAKKPAGVKRRR